MLSEGKWLHGGRKVAGNPSLLDALLQTYITKHAFLELQCFCSKKREGDGYYTMVRTTFRKGIRIIM